MNYLLQHLLRKVRQNLALVIVAWSGFVVMGYLMLTLAPPIYLNEPDFDGVAIHAKIEQVVSYSRGIPRVLLSDKRNLLLHIHGGGQKYVRAGDSVVNERYHDTLTVYRCYPIYTEVRMYGDSEDYEKDLDYPYSGLLQRYRIPHNPQ